MFKAACQEGLAIVYETRSPISNPRRPDRRFAARQHDRHDGGMPAGRPLHHCKTCWSGSTWVIRFFKPAGAPVSPS